MKRLANILVSVCFAAFLFLAMAATVLRTPEYSSFFENRDLAAFPELTAESVLDGTFFTGLEAFFSDHAAGRTTLMKLKTRLDMDIFSRPVVNTVVVTDNDLLQYNDYTSYSDEEIGRMADDITANLSQVDALVESYGGAYYYVAIPNQYAVRGGSYPWYLNDQSGFFSRALPALSSRLEKAGVGFIDVGKAYEALGTPDYLTSPVDNHFSIYGAFVSYQAIMDRINADTGLGLDVLRDEDVSITEMPDYYMGSRTQMLMNQRQSADHLSILEPHEKIPFTRCDNGSRSEPEIYVVPEGAQWLTYGMYMNGDNAETVINTARPELPSILVYGDSFTNGVECIIYNGFNVMRSLDLRHYEDMSLGEYIEEYKPDVVICIRDYSAVLVTAYNGSGPYATNVE